MWRITTTRSRALGYTPFRTAWTRQSQLLVPLRSFATNDNQGGITITKTTAEELKNQPPPAPPKQDPASYPTKKSLRLPDKDKEMELHTLTMHVQTHYRHGNYPDALQAAKELLDATQDHFGKDHPATASAYNNIALMHKNLGAFQDSRLNYNEALRIYDRVVGKDHASYAAALHNIGSLHKAQVHLDESLPSLERVELQEIAAEYLEEAWQIRRDELGNEHPHTVASRSSLGATMASLVLQQQQVLLDRQRQSQKGEKGPLSSWKPTRLTRRRWEAAEEHLREALLTAIDNPRGKRIASAATITTTTTTEGGTETTKNKMKKKKKMFRRKNAPPTTAAPSLAAPSRIVTLSAASAAQNLAVFLKSKAALMDGADTKTDVNDTDATANASSSSPLSSMDNKEDLFSEAKQLYEQALAVREELLENPAHPDFVATKHSLAELLLLIGDEARANKLREEIMDLYDVEERDDEGGNDEGGEDSGPR